jgi:hypothetical protein
MPRARDHIPSHRFRFTPSQARKTKKKKKKNKQKQQKQTRDEGKHLNRWSKIYSTPHATTKSRKIAELTLED